MSRTVFTKVEFSLTALIEKIKLGEIGLPDIQRPFVWPNAKVRNLFDSMFKGFPVGYLLFWANIVPEGVRHVGTDLKQRVPSSLIVDGQQRLTSLYAVLTGTPVLRDDYKEERIRIGFRPSDRTFEVADAAIDKDVEFIPDVSQLWVGDLSPHKFVSAFVDRLRERRDVPDDEEDQIAGAIDAVYDLRNYPFTALELSSTVSEEQVAEVFVRINSEGTKLSQADFILTLMSVWWDKGRRTLEEFARESRTAGTPVHNHFLSPDPDQMLRVSVGLAFRRARLQHVYSILRGKDLETEQFSSEEREKQFARLEEAQAFALDSQNWQEFLKSLVRAGYRKGETITSKIGLLYTYTLFLVGKRDFGVDPFSLRNVIARWFFMTTLTGRYTGSPETAMERDLARLRDVTSAAGFVRTLDTVVEETFTRDYWNITLPGELATSAARSPSLFAYYAALNLLDARVLFSKLRVSELMDPTTTGKKSAIERHHLFPKAYLAAVGITSLSSVNQIANFALVEWPDNIAISSADPVDYWPEMERRMAADELAEMRYWHALPEGWERMQYQEFLAVRRRGIAKVIADGFARLEEERHLDEERQERELRALAKESLRRGSADLIAEGEGVFVEFKESARWSHIAGDREKTSELEVARSIAGFLNAKGGTLFIGVHDQRGPVGLARDYKSVQKRPDRDGWENWLTGMLRQRLGVSFFAQMRVRFIDLDGREVCRIDVQPARKPAFVDGSRFFVRVNNTTQELRAAEMIEYLERRGPGRAAIASSAPPPDEEAEYAAATREGTQDDTRLELDDEDQPPEGPDEEGESKSWPHDRIRQYVQSDFLARCVDEFDEWLLEHSDPDADLRHLSYAYHVLYERGRRILFYYYARRWMYFRLEGSDEDDVEVFRSLSTAERSKRGDNWYVGRVATEDDLELLKERLAERLGAGRG